MRLDICRKLFGQERTVGLSPVREATLLKMKPGHLKELEAQVEEMTGLYSKSFDLVERCGIL